MSTHEVDRASFWEGEYQKPAQGWELGEAAPPIVRWLDSGSAPAPGAAVVPGCGRGHEVVALATRGWQAVGIDFAPSAIVAGRAAAAKAGVVDRAKFVKADLFTVGERPELAGKFDLALEHTCFCAIDPARRDAYVDALAALLRPRGTLAGLFYAHSRPGGPPFATDEVEVRRRFGRRFRVISMETAPDSIPRRRGEELLAVMERLP